MKKKSTIKLIIDVLLTGKPMMSKDITEEIEKLSGKKVKIQNISSMLSRISNTKNCDLGYFIEKKSFKNSFIYKIFEDAADFLTSEQAYGLTLTTGQYKYSLKQALEDYPELNKYIKKPSKKIASKAKSNKSKTIKNSKPLPSEELKKDKPDIPKPVPETQIPSVEKDIFTDMEQLAKQLKALDGINDMDIRDIDVKVSFRLAKSAIK